MFIYEIMFLCTCIFYSIFNMDEIVVLLKYINLIMKEQINGKQVCQEDIGIISPYKKQVILHLVIQQQQ